MQHSKPKTDVYTVLLIVALLALIIGCVFLYLERAHYGSNPTSGVPSASVVWSAGPSPASGVAPIAPDRPASIADAAVPAGIRT